MNDICVVFDLDDTLYKEIDFLKSGFRYVIEHIHHCEFADNDLFNKMIEAYQNGNDAFEIICSKCKTKIEKSILLSWYRFHFPSLTLSKETENVLYQLSEAGIKLGIISDGRSITQRNKIKALGLERYFDAKTVIISEEFGSAKPCERNYKYFHSYYPNCKKYVYIGDNPTKDFIMPNTLGWLTLGLRNNGDNIHKQENFKSEKAPQMWISSISEIFKIL